MASTRHTRSAQRSVRPPRENIRGAGDPPNPVPQELVDKALLLVRENPTEDSFALARTVIEGILTTTEPISASDKVLFVHGLHLSSATLPGYATLDQKHMRDIRALTATINEYANDPSRKRPLNFFMLASPGAGKSHFIKCVANHLGTGSIKAITYNMAALEKNDDLISTLDAARNVKVEDKLPLLFLDEIDSKWENVSLLLPLLWDGEINLGQRDLKLGKIIIVMAGSASELPTIMEHARSMRREFLHAVPNPKVNDLFSRINGGTIVIPPFYDLNHQVNRRADKACAAVELLRERYGKTLKTVPASLLRFIVQAEFRYGVRSIAHLVTLLPFAGQIETLTSNALSALPFQNAKKLKESSLSYHLLHEDQESGIIELWKAAASRNDLLPLYDEVEHFIPSWDPTPEVAKRYIEAMYRKFSEGR